jgi:hypothetical protein
MNVARFQSGMWRWCAVAAIALVVLYAVTPELLCGEAWAGPGGIVKSAARSTVGKILFALLAIVLLPFILYYAVRSAIARKKTKADLARLAQQYPQYRWLDIHDRATAVFSWVWSEWSQGKIDNAKAFCTPWYWQNQQLQLDEWERNGLKNVSRLVKIESISPVFVQHMPNMEGSRVMVDIKARVIDYLQDAQGNVVQGDKAEGDLDTLWTLVWQNTAHGGAWMLNKIEEGSNEFEYLFAPNEVPATVGQTAKTTV